MVVRDGDIHEMAAEHARQKKQAVEEAQSALEVERGV
jgi:hypothetical protein